MKKSVDVRFMEVTVLDMSQLAVRSLKLGARHNSLKHIKYNTYSVI